MPGCGATEALEIDHRIPLALGGSEEITNLEPRCGPHHREKTKADVRAIAKAKRLAGETGNGRKRLIRSRGFDKRLSKGFDGKVRRRT